MGGHVGGNAFKSGSVHVDGNMGRMHAYSSGNMGRVHTNPGGKYVYRVATAPFAPTKAANTPDRANTITTTITTTTPPTWRLPWWYGLPLYSYGYGTGGCGWLYRQAAATGSDFGGTGTISAPTITDLAA